MLSRVGISRNAALPLLAEQSVLASLTARAHFLILAPIHIILYDDPRVLDLNLQSSANLFSVRFRGGIRRARCYAHCWRGWLNFSLRPEFAVCAELS